MSKQDKPDAWAELTDAARGLERELRRFEQLAEEARRSRLDTRKGIERAAKATTEAAGAQRDVELALGGLVQAIANVRTRHEANAAALQTRGEEISARATEIAGLLERYGALGDEAARVNAIVGELAKKDVRRDPAEALVTITEVEERTSSLVDGARALSEEASTVGLGDLAQQADGLRQQVAAARNKLGLLRKVLSSEPTEPTKLN